MVANMNKIASDLPSACYKITLSNLNFIDDIFKHFTLRLIKFMGRSRDGMATFCYALSM